MAAKAIPGLPGHERLLAGGRLLEVVQKSRTCFVDVVCYIEEICRYTSKQIVCVYIYVHMYIYIYIYMNMRLYAYMSMCVCTYIYIYIYVIYVYE